MDIFYIIFQMIFLPISHLIPSEYLKKEALSSAHEQQKQFASWFVNIQPELYASYHFYTIVRNNYYISVYVCNLAL